jgi:Uma2 family endonuclease
LAIAGRGEGGNEMDDLTAKVPSDFRMSRDEYRRWAEQQESGRFERVDGVVVRMPAERLIHVERKLRVAIALRQAVAATGLPNHVYGDGVTVEVDDSDFEPDAVVRAGSDKLPDDAISVPDPLIVVEVLSPSTRATDLTLKLAAYFRVPSIQHYLIFWPNNARVVHHRRKADRDIIETKIVTSGEFRLDPPGISIRIDDIYAD